MKNWSVVTGNLDGEYEVRLFDTKDEATDWALYNPEYITEVVEVTP